MQCCPRKHHQEFQSKFAWKSTVQGILSRQICTRHTENSKVDGAAQAAHTLCPQPGRLLFISLASRANTSKLLRTMPICTAPQPRRMSISQELNCLLPGVSARTASQGPGSRAVQRPLSVSQQWPLLHVWTSHRTGCLQHSPWPSWHSCQEGSTSHLRARDSSTGKSEFQLLG